MFKENRNSRTCTTEDNKKCARCAEAGQVFKWNEEEQKQIRANISKDLLGCVK